MRWCWWRRVMFVHTFTYRSILFARYDAKNIVFIVFVLSSSTPSHFLCHYHYNRKRFPNIVRARIFLCKQTRWNESSKKLLYIFSDISAECAEIFEEIPDVLSLSIRFVRSWLVYIETYMFPEWITPESAIFPVHNLNLSRWARVLEWST